MNTAHEGLGITESDWKTSINLLTTALNKYRVAPRIDRCADDPPLRSAGVGAFLAGPEVHKNQPSALFAHDVLSLDVP